MRWALGMPAAWPHPPPMSGIAPPSAPGLALMQSMPSVTAGTPPLGKGQKSYGQWGVDAGLALLVSVLATA